MRRIVVLVMGLAGIMTLIAAIAEASPEHGGLPVLHIVVATIFGVSCLTHIWLNRKSILRYLKVKK